MNIYDNRREFTLQLNSLTPVTNRPDSTKIGSIITLFPILVDNCACKLSIH